MLLNLIFAETGDIEGYVFEKNTNRVIKGANIVLEGTEKGGFTDLNGYFSIENLPTGKYKLICSYIGYKKFQKIVNVQTEKSIFLNISLEKTSIKGKEIQVYGNQDEIGDISEINLSKKEIQYTPSIGEPDLFRTLVSYPGVTKSNDFNLGLYIRGGNRDQNLILLDGIPIQSPYHLSGIFSTFDANVIQNSEFSKIVDDSKYGNRLSSILSINTRDGDIDEHKGYVNISLLSSKIRAEGPWKYGSYMFSLRRTYADLVFNSISTVVGSKYRLPYHLTDGMGKLVFKKKKRHRLELTTYFGRDYFDIGKMDQSEDIGDYIWANSAAGLRHFWYLSPQIYFVSKLSYSNFVANFTHDDPTYSDAIDNKFQTTILSTYLNYDNTYTGNLQLGGEIKKFKTSLYSRGFSYKPINFETQTPQELSVFFNNEKNFRNLIGLKLGGRLTYFSNKEVNKLSHYISIEPYINSDFSINLQYSKTHQNMITLATEEVLISMFDAWCFPPENYPVMKSSQFAISGEYNFKPYNITVSLYKKNITPLVEYNTEKYLETDKNFVVGKCKAYGLELLLEKRVGDLTGNFSYTYSYSEKSLYNINYTPKYNKPHQLVLSSIYNYNKKWKIGMSFKYHTGRPFTKKIGEFEDSYYGNEFTYHSGGYGESPIYSKKSSFRLPAYHRLDFNITKKFKWHDNPFEWYLNLINVYGRLNVLGYSSDGEKWIQIPPMATIGIRGKLW